MPDFAVLVTTKNKWRVGRSSYTAAISVAIRLPTALAQASGSRIGWIADGLAGDEKFHSPVLLTAAGVVVGGYRQRVAEASG